MPESDNDLFIIDNCSKRQEVESMRHPNTDEIGLSRPHPCHGISEHGCVGLRIKDGGALERSVVVLSEVSDGMRQQSSETPTIVEAVGKYPRPIDRKKSLQNPPALAYHKPHFTSWVTWRHDSSMAHAGDWHPQQTPSQPLLLPLAASQLPRPLTRFCLSTPFSSRS
jgi:hypothetical protein